MNQHQASLIGTLIVNPYKFIEIQDIITADMFSDEYKPIIELIFSYSRENKFWDKAIIQRQSQWTTKELLNVISYANANTLEDNARYIREDYITEKGIELATEYITKAPDDNETAYHKLKTELEGLYTVTRTEKDNKAEIFSKAVDSLLKSSKDEGIVGISTGWSDLDQMLGGWVDGNLIIIGARPSMGKTTIMLHHAMQASFMGYSVGVMSLEMTKQELISKIIASMAGVSVSRIRTGNLTEQDKENIAEKGAELYDYPIYIQDFNSKARVTINTISDEVNYMVKRQGVQMILIDYLQLIDYSGNQNANYEVQNISRMLKRIAKNCNVPIIALAQLSRGIENRADKRPVMSDLRDSGSIEQDADIVIGLYRDEYYNPDSGSIGILEYAILKDRQGGIPFTLEREFNKGLYIEPNKVPF